MGSAFEIAKVFGALIGLLTGVYVTYWQIRQRQISKALSLEDNPERCGRHEEAIKRLRQDMDTLADQNRDDHRQLFNQVGALGIEIAKLNRNGGGHGGSAK